MPTSLAFQTDRSSPPAALPTPSGLHFLIAVLLIASCLSAAGLGLALLFFRPDPCAVVGGLILTALPLWLAQLQYRSTFRCDLPAARKMKICWLIFAGFLAVQIPVGALLQLPRYQELAVLYLLILSLLLAAGVAGNLLQRSWVRELKEFGSDLPNSPMWKFNLGELLLMMAAAALTLGVMSACLRAASGRYAEHVPADKCPFALPAGAGNVSYCYSPWQQLGYEFSIDEAGAAEWAASLDLYLFTRITSNYEIPRYSSLHPRLQQSKSATITNGWQTAGYVDGRPVSIAYDKQARRAYYFAGAP